MTPSVVGNRAEWDLGSLVEWIENAPKGVEQGWEIARRPPGLGALWIGLALEGDLSLRIESGARSATLVDPHDVARLCYRDLRAFDATGRELEASLEPSPAGLGVCIDDTNASYPLHVDPLLTGPTWTCEGNQTLSRFGFALGTAGDVNGDGLADVIVGAPEFDAGETDEGRVFVYLNSSAGLPLAPSWSVEGDQTGAQFGYVACTAGDVNGDGYSDVLIGAAYWDNTVADAGAIYCYLGSASGLAATPAFTFSPGVANTGIGKFACTAGDLNADGFSDVLVGAPQMPFGSVIGAVWVFLGTPSGLQILPPPRFAPQSGSSFGVGLAPAGDVNGDGYVDVLIGAPSYDNGISDRGIAYLYLGSATGMATTASWSVEGELVSAYMGAVVASAGDVDGDGFGDVLVGATNHPNGSTGEGKVYLFRGSASGPVAPAWTRTGTVTQGHLGSLVASAGDVNGDGYGDVLIGHASTISTVSGLSLWLGSAAGLAATPTWTQDNLAPGDGYGQSAAPAGDLDGDGYGDVLVAATTYSGDQPFEGRVYLYPGSPEGLATSPVWSTEGGQAGAHLGTSVAYAGDVDGDGYGDLIVGASGFDNGQTDEGRVLVFTGSGTGPSPAPQWSIEGGQSGAQLGSSVAVAGDINGDGYDDVIVGAPGYDGGQTDEGRAVVYLGSAEGLQTIAAWTAESDQANALFGGKVASAGDVNGDGFADVLVGASGFTGASGQGRAYLYLGSATGLPLTPSRTFEVTQFLASFPSSVASAGDVNADGFSDILLGGELLDLGQVDEGAALLFLGGPSGPATSADWTGEGNQSGAHYGHSVASAGDVNGDGFSDIVIGATGFDAGETDEGLILVYLGSPTGPSTLAADWTVESNQSGAALGSAVDGAGDVNGDGYGDLVVGASSFDGGPPDEGRAFLYLGSASGLGAAPAWTLDSFQRRASLGESVSGAGDVNGDGYSDVIVGAPLRFVNQADEGGAYVFLGNGGRGGHLHRLQQMDKNDVRPLALLGSAGPNGLFRIRTQFPRSLATFHWAARGAPLVYLEWEVMPLGVPFDGSNILRSAPYSLGGLGVVDLDESTGIDDVVAHLRTTLARSYHWRARVATNNVLSPHTPWFSQAGNDITEAKLRKPEH